MNSENFQAITKNKYFVPVLVGLIIALGGLYLGSGKDKAKTDDTETKAPEVVDIQNKKGLKDLFFGQKEFDLSYAGLDPSSVENVAFFESNEGWKGTGALDWKNFYEGKTSLSVTSNDTKPGAISLDKALDLTNFKTIELFMSLNEVEPVESVIIKFGDASLSNYYSYAISNFIQGWKLVKIPQNQFVANISSAEFSWKDIKKIQIELISRPNSLAIANFDYLTVQKNNDYLNQWKTLNENFLSLGKAGDKIALTARNEGASQAVLKDISGNDFTYQASFIAQKPGGLGLFFRGNYGNNKGYYFLAGGLNTTSVSLNKSGLKGWETLKTVEISNFVFEKDTKYWLRVKTGGKNLTGYISTNGNDFTELFSLNDDEFSSGGVGVAAFSRAYGFFDDFKFNQ